MSCSDSREDTPVQFLWNQTGCADPWNALSSDTNEDIAEAIEIYLSENEIQNATVTNFEFDASVASGCLACGCTTGVVIRVETLEVNGSKMEALGFIRDTQE